MSWRTLNKLLYNVSYENELSFDNIDTLTQNNPELESLIQDKNEKGLILKTDQDSKQIPPDRIHNPDLSKQKVNDKAKNAAKKQLNK